MSTRGWPAYPNPIYMEINMDKEQLLKGRCQPCEGIGSAMSLQQAEPYMAMIEDWQMVEAKQIEKVFSTKNFVDAMNFANQITEIAEAEDHHPDLHVSYRSLKVDITTHALGGLSENDFILAAKIDQVRKDTE